MDNTLNPQTAYNELQSKQEELKQEALSKHTELVKIVETTSTLIINVGTKLNNAKNEANKDNISKFTKELKSLETDLLKFSNDLKQFEETNKFLLLTNFDLAMLQNQESVNSMKKATIKPSKDIQSTGDNLETISSLKKDNKKYFDDIVLELNRLFDVYRDEYILATKDLDDSELSDLKQGHELLSKKSSVKGRVALAFKAIRENLTTTALKHTESMIELLEWYYGSRVSFIGDNLTLTNIKAFKDLSLIYSERALNKLGRTIDTKPTKETLRTLKSVAKILPKLTYSDKVEFQLLESVINGVEIGANNTIKVNIVKVQEASSFEIAYNKALYKCLNGKTPTITDIYNEYPNSEK